MNRLSVSVVIPTFNRAGYILDSLESVFAQSFRDYEIIVVDDGSSDDTVKRLQPLVKAKRLRLLQQDHAGVSAARNRGVEEAIGKYIAFLDSDDLFHSEKLAKQLALFEQKPDLGFVHSNFDKFDDRGRQLGLRDMSQFRGMVYPEILQEWSYLMALPTLMLPKEIFEQVGAFDEQISWGEDIDLYFRITRKYEIDLVPETLCRVRVHAASASASKIGSAESFHVVLQKAIEADAELPRPLVQKAFAKLYVNKSQNLLGDGGTEEMRMARRLASKALSYRPMEIAAWLALLGSLLPNKLRRRLSAALRKLRYPST